MMTFVLLAALAQTPPNVPPDNPPDWPPPIENPKPFVWDPKPAPPIQVCDPQPDGSLICY